MTQDTIRSRCHSALPGSASAKRSAIAKASAEALGKGLATLADLFRMLDTAVSAIPTRPESIEMEFKAKLTAECDLWVVSDGASSLAPLTLGPGPMTRHAARRINFSRIAPRNRPRQGE